MSNNKDILIKTAIVVMGISGITAQVILLREMLIISFGNELIIGIILANWLFLEAFGSWLGSKVKAKHNNFLYILLFLQIIFALSLPVCLILTRLSAQLAGVPVGSGMGLIILFFSSLIILLPVSTSHGFLFPIYCQIFSRKSAKESTAINYVYIWELIGTVIGGIVLTFILIPLLPTIRIILIISLLNLTIIFLIFIRNRKDLVIANKVITPVSLFFLLILITLNIFLLIPQVSHKLHSYSITRQWRGENVIYYQNSNFGNIAVSESEGQFTFYSDGQPIVITPDADIVFSETLVHVPLLSHPQPQEILIISGGAGGVITEILKHKPANIVYTELDPLMIEVLKKFPTELTEYELNHPSVKVEKMDGRRYVEQSDKEFDIIFIGIGEPADLQTNRLYSVDFYWQLLDRMKADGILAFTLPGSLTYLTDELRYLNKITENSLREVFHYHYVIPGDFNLFIASRKEIDIIYDPDALGARLRERGIETKVITQGYLDYILHPRWQTWYKENTQHLTRTYNRDFTPISLFWSLSYWNSIFSPQTQKIFLFFHKMSFTLLMRWLIILLLILLLAIFLFHKKPLLVSLPLTITTSGFSGMILDLTIIYIFQILFGFVFLWIGMLFIAYMSGSILGAIYSNNKINKLKLGAKQFLNRLIRLDLLIILFVISLPFFIATFSTLKTKTFLYQQLPYIFLLLPLCSGFLIGAQFPLAVKPYLGKSKNFEKSSGVLYALDLLGGWVGGIIGGVFFLPIFGLVRTLFFIVILKIFSICLLFITKRKEGII